MIAATDIKDYCREVAAAFRPEKIVLFGSYAYGEPTEDSDVDVLVVLKKPRHLWLRTAQRIREGVRAGFPVDVLVRDPVFLRERLKEGDCFLEEIVHRGKVMYESGHS